MSQQALGSNSSRGHTALAAGEEQQDLEPLGIGQAGSTGLGGSRWWGCPHRSDGQGWGSHSSNTGSGYPQGPHGQKSYWHCSELELQ